MRAFHLLSKQHALQALQNQRLKVAIFDDLNDPFELLAADLSDRRVRRRFVKWKTRTSKKIGLLCFSMTWRNPLLWSHYADRHRGVALEFEIEDDFVVPVQYSLSRMRLNVPHIMSSVASPKSSRSSSPPQSLSIGHMRRRSECRWPFQNAFLRAACILKG